MAKKIRKTSRLPKSWFWAVAVTPQQDLIKWGLDGDNKRPYSSYKRAEEQLKDVQKSVLRTGKEDRYYVLRVFANGCMKTFEVDLD